MTEPTLNVPAHVPPHLVRDVVFDELPGMSEDPHHAVAFLYQGPDIFYSPRAVQAEAAWMLTRSELVREVYQNSDLFSSAHGADFSALMGETWPLIPLEIDPPQHAKWRALLNPLFGPRQIDALEPGVRQTCVELIEAARKKGECEFVEDFARPFPVTIFLRLLGLPIEETAQFLVWEDGILHGATMEQRVGAARAIKDRLMQAAEDRRKQPTGDLISFTVQAKIDGWPVTEEEVLGTLYLLFVAGLDTVTGTLGFFFRHLVLDPALQRRLRQDKSQIPAAMEEMFRAYSIINSRRLVTRDTEFHGVTMKKGDRVVASTMLADRDDREFPDPNRVDIDRENVRHTAFAVGPHRCLGSHLARREIRIALEEWFARVPEFRVKPGSKITTQPGAVWGVTHMPLVW